MITAAVAAALFLGVIPYALLGGADFGSGFYDLTAGGGVAGAQLRALIEESMGPVWEANHVWLIYIIDRRGIRLQWPSARQSPDGESHSIPGCGRPTDRPGGGRCEHHS
jgi:Cytochrome bd terminal oxidase subunit II